MRIRATCLTVALLLAGVSSAGEKKTSLVIKSLSGIHAAVGKGMTFRVQIKGPIPDEPLIWQLHLAGLERASGVLFNDHGKPSNSFDIPVVVTSEEVEKTRAQYDDDPVVPSRVSSVQMISVQVALFRARDGQRVADATTTISVGSRFGSRGPRNAAN